MLTFRDYWCVKWEQYHGFQRVATRVFKSPWDPGWLSAVVRMFPPKVISNLNSAIAYDQTTFQRKGTTCNTRAHDSSGRQVSCSRRPDWTGNSRRRGRQDSKSARGGARTRPSASGRPAPPQPQQGTTSIFLEIRADPGTLRLLASLPPSLWKDSELHDGARRTRDKVGSAIRGPRPDGAGAGRNQCGARPRGWGQGCPGCAGRWPQHMLAAPLVLRLEPSHPRSCHNCDPLLYLLVILIVWWERKMEPLESGIS